MRAEYEQQLYVPSFGPIFDALGNAYFFNSLIWVLLSCSPFCNRKTLSKYSRFEGAGSPYSKHISDHHCAGSLGCTTQDYLHNDDRYTTSSRESHPPQNGYILIRFSYCHLFSFWTLMTEKRIVIPLTVPSSHMHDWKSYTNIAVFAGSLEVESELIYMYYVMGGRSRVTLTHMKSPYSRTSS